MTIASYYSFRNALAADFLANFVTPFSLPTQWENAPFTPPQNAIAWVRFQIIHGREECTQIGPQNLYRAGSMFKPAIFVPVVQGIGFMMQLADLIADRYRGSFIGGVTFQGVQINDPRPDEAMPDWFTCSVDCYFNADLAR